MIKIRYNLECRCAECDSYIIKNEYISLNEDEDFTLKCDLCDCEILSIIQKDVFKKKEYKK